MWIVCPTKFINWLRAVPTLYTLDLPYHNFSIFERGDKKNNKRLKMALKKKKKWNQETIGYEFQGDLYYI